MKQVCGNIKYSGTSKMTFSVISNYNQKSLYTDNGDKISIWNIKSNNSVHIIK